jgi:hypothetical protein
MVLLQKHTKIYCCYLPCMFRLFRPSLVGWFRKIYFIDCSTRMFVKYILQRFKVITLLTSLRYETSQVLRRFLISSWSYHVTDVLVSFQPLRHPCDPDSHREEGISSFLRNAGTHINHLVYETKRPPTETSLWTLALFVAVNVIFH